MPLGASLDFVGFAKDLRSAVSRATLVSRPPPPPKGDFLKMSADFWWNCCPLINLGGSPPILGFLFSFAVASLTPAVVSFYV